MYLLVTSIIFHTLVSLIKSIFESTKKNHFFFFFITQKYWCHFRYLKFELCRLKTYIRMCISASSQILSGASILSNLWTELIRIKSNANIRYSFDSYFSHQLTKKYLNIKPVNKCYCARVQSAHCTHYGRNWIYLYVCVLLVNLHNVKRIHTHVK